ncbi:MAG: hypothetical protein EA359_11800 [Balneolaceae bacterium]|nr:MAG: hypothetical protein EA359_11800 [Balneolaceae bacterium]
MLKISDTKLLFILILIAYGCAGDNHLVLQPNILLIMTDDQGFGDVGYHGNPDIQTPNMDQLAQEGAWFRQFYVSSVCAPTRASLLTGRYSMRTGTQWVTRNLESMHPDEVTLAHIFREAGYKTAIFGKWHNGEHYPSNPFGMGFDLFFGFNGGHHNNYFDTQLEYNGEMVQTEGYISDVLTDSTIAFIKRNHNHPFLAYVPYNAPHSPFQLSDKYYDRYAAMGYDARTASAYGMVENIDDNLGRLLTTLDELGIAENTIVIFLTDNGPNGQRYNAFMRGIKASVHEGGVRVPMFFRWPGKIDAGTVIEELTAHIDLLPTLVDLTGIPKTVTNPLDGSSFAGLLLNQQSNFPDDRLLFFHHSRWDSLEVYPGSVRNHQYRLVREYDRDWELFDMKADPGQQFDITHLQPAMADSFKQAYYEWFGDVTANLPSERRIPVGYKEAPGIRLPAPQAFCKGVIGYHGAGWANDWLDNWTSTEDRAWWYLDVINPGSYEVVAEYSVAEPNLGTRVRFSIGDSFVEGVFDQPHDPGFIHSPDRLPRGEVYEKESWAFKNLGVIQLPEGKHRLTARAMEIPGETSIELKSIRLNKVE